MTDANTGEIAKRALDGFIDCVVSAKSSQAGNVELSKIYRDFCRSLEQALLPAGSLMDNEVRKGAQSKQFMMQIAPYIQSYMRRHERGRVFEVLDVGCGTGHGSNLLASLYQTFELGYRARVTAVDIDETYHDYARFFCPYVLHKVVDDIGNIGRQYDVVIASHVVEHVEDPIGFVESLKRMTSGLLVVCAPYMENPDLLTSSHLNIIDDDMIARFGPTGVVLLESPAWGQFMEPRYKMFVALFEIRDITGSAEEKR